MNRREFLLMTAGAAMAARLRERQTMAAEAPEPIVDLHRHVKEPAQIASLELLRAGKVYFLRSTSKRGAVGLAQCNDRVAYLYPILLKKVIPCFLGRDARDLERLVDRAYVSRSNYKLSGLPFWCCVAYVEFSLLDLLGKLAKKPLGALLGGVIRTDVPVYLSSLRRDTTPRQEIEWLGKRIEQTGAKAVKLKVGGRMSRNADAAPGRTDRLIPLARKTWGKDVTIHVDSNGSYDAPKAVEVGRMLQQHDVYFFEEPCRWEDFEATRQVTDALEMRVAGGEQDTSFEKFRWYVRHRGLDVVQPDLTYNGGFVRTLRVARLAAGAGLDITPHCPRGGFDPVYMLHFASVTKNLGRFQEFRGELRGSPAWMSPGIKVRNGRLTVPNGPGLGVSVDPDFLKKAKRIT